MNLAITWAKLISILDTLYSKLYCLRTLCFILFPAVREDRAPGGRPRIKSLLTLKEHHETYGSSQMILEFIQARPDCVPTIK